MQRDDHKPPRNSLSELLSKKWQKGDSRAPLDRMLEEEYETLLREIDYLTCCEKSCLLSFKNEYFNHKSSEDLGTVLSRHSDRALKTYADNHRTNSKKKSFDSRNSLVNYVTEIVVSRPKCNRNLCKCGEGASGEGGKQREKIEKGSSTQSRDTKEVTSQIDDVHSRRDQGAAATVQTDRERHHSQIQTDHWDRDPNCTCGCCPKTTSHTVSSLTKPHLQDASTSDKKLTTTSKMTLANCTGDTRDALTSTTRVCIPENYSSGIDKFTRCNLDKKDCECEVFDAKEAVKRGLVLPASEFCIQTKRTIVKSGGTQSKDVNIMVREQKASTSSETSSSETKKKKKNKVGCFGGKKKKGCDERCQGLILHEQSVQTLPRLSQEAARSPPPRRRTADTSTDSDASVQVSLRQINESQNRTLRMDKQTSQHEQKTVEGRKSSGTGKGLKWGQGDQEKTSVCNKCGRQKRDCASACRNTFIIPYASGSNRAIPAGDSESLRMLIKMQSKDTNRQIDTIMTEISHQKTEIRRLNDMYQKVVETVYETQKSISSYNQSNVSQKSAQRSEGSRSCGCSNGSECKPLGNKRDKKSKTSVKISPNNNQNISSNKRYGPPNTAVAINMCDTCTVEIAANNTRSCPPQNQGDYECFDKYLIGSTRST
ncbi:uncharacterized protein LOC126746175 isoform X2 [Anthonomus grandis grandis]|uniref:uncharacterized protein LOC126746175 isoform X2 n=1 Tax=Anthonomus grandis grandis TaxID=2921223 RepID=UPI0021668ED3|nr:uncharacterized protein LOC126746175 isoform X2 [Anthonomus grandis grandis]